MKRGRKYAQVLAGAREVFLREGYEGASVDEIARKAGVSKATLYSYFREKKHLFLEVARLECLRQSESAVTLSTGSASIREILRDVADRMTAFFFSDIGLNVFRICVAESERFPELGRAFYLSGPALAQERLEAILQAAVARGELDIVDFRLAAAQFCELCKADVFPMRIFNIAEATREADRRRVVEGAVEMFMAGYAPRRGVTAAAG